MKLHESIRIEYSRESKYQYPEAVLTRQLAYLSDMLSRETAPYYVDIHSWYPVGLGTRASYTRGTREINNVFREYMLPYRCTDIWPVITKNRDGYIVCTKMRLVLVDVGLNDLLWDT